MKKVKIVGVELLRFNKYLVTPSCKHSFVNDTSVVKLKDVPDYITCMRCPTNEQTIDTHAMPLADIS